MASRLPPLDHKLLRDLWRMRGQASAIAMVIALGVLTLVMMDGLINSLDQTRQAYYERYRLADVFAPVKRAPEHLLKDMMQIPGVSSVEGRIDGAALIDLPDLPVPIRAEALSLPDFRAPRLNDIYLTSGRRLDPAHDDEVILLNDFANAHHLKPGDRITVTMNGARKKFRIVGLAQSPEFLFSAPPGELMPDDARFAVLWMNRRTLEAAFDLKGAFNEALLSISRDANLPYVLDAIDRMLDPYGGLGSYSVADQISNRFIHEEVKQLRLSGNIIPPIFLAVAAFLLNIVISRMVQSEREQIGLLKAFGYTSYEIGLHYFKFILSIAIGGAILGCILGIYAGRLLTGVYLIYYKFPFLIFQLNPRVFLVGITVSILAASAGGLFVLRKVFALTPAVAMRPPAPADYSRSFTFGKRLKAILDQPFRMVLRRLMRQPLRAGIAVVGIAAGMALSVSMLSIMGSFDRAAALNFDVIDRSDANVTFIEPYADKTIFDLKRMKGVFAVEPFRNVAAVLRHGPYSYRSGIEGLISAPSLKRAVDADAKEIYINPNGVTLSQSLVDILHIKPGEILTIEVHEGRRPVLEEPVVAITSSLLGSPAYMEIGALDRALKEPGRVSGAYLKIDPSQGAALYSALKEMPSVAGVSLKSEARVAFQKMIDQSAGAIRYIMTIIAGIITFGVIYNSARIAFAERQRDLASLRVIGFTRGEAAFVLLGELVIITLLALPLGSLFGYYLSLAMSLGFSTDLYQVPAYVIPESYGIAALAVLAASAISGWIVKRDIDRIDLVSTLKTRD